MTNLYFLVYPKLRAFKIGKADDVFSRAYGIKKYWGNPNYIDSFSLSIDDSLVFKLEKALHLMLDQFSMNFSKGDGKTEFFDIDALSDAINYAELFIKSNKLSMCLVKGVNSSINEEIAINKHQDHIFRKHNNSRNRVGDYLSYNTNNIKTVLRVNNILIRYRKRIRFVLELIGCEYFLTLYRRKKLTQILFDCLRLKVSYFSGGFVGVNLSRSLQTCEDYYKLTISFESSNEDPLIVVLSEELRSSFDLVKKSGESV